MFFHFGESGTLHNHEIIHFWIFSVNMDMTVSYLWYKFEKLIECVLFGISRIQWSNPTHCVFIRFLHYPSDYTRKNAEKFFVFWGFFFKIRFLFKNFLSTTLLFLLSLPCSIYLNKFSEHLYWHISDGLTIIPLRHIVVDFNYLAWWIYHFH